MTPRNVVLEGDALEVLRTLATASVDAVVTSPPVLPSSPLRGWAG